jgi:excisionase family DNA binding protein
VFRLVRNSEDLGTLDRVRQVRRFDGDFLSRSVTEPPPRCPFTRVKAVVGRPLITLEEGAMRTNDRPSSEPSARWYDVPELARMLRVSEDFIRAQVQQRRIPYYKVGKLIRFDPREIAHWLAGRHMEPL